MPEKILTHQRLTEIVDQYKDDYGFRPSVNRQLRQAKEEWTLAESAVLGTSFFAYSDDFKRLFEIEHDCQNEQRDPNEGELAEIKDLIDRKLERAIIYRFSSDSGQAWEKYGYRDVSQATVQEINRHHEKANKLFDTSSVGKMMNALSEAIDYTPDESTLNRNSSAHWTKWS